MNWFGVVLFIAAVVGCATASEKRVASLKELSAKFAPLDEYQELRCEFTVRFAAPIRASAQVLKGERLEDLKGVEAMTMSWRVTPSLCQVTMPEGENRLGSQGREAARHIRAALCVWLRSFYAESPLRLKGRFAEDWVDVPMGYRLAGQGGRYLEVERTGAEVLAHLGPGQLLRGQYQDRERQWLPYRISYQNTAGGKEGLVAEMTDIKYVDLAGQMAPESFWLNLGGAQKPAQAFMEFTLKPCHRRGLAPRLGL